MNIFLNQEGLLQAVQNQAPAGTLIPLFQLVPQIEQQFDNNKYSVYEYVFLFFKSLYYINAHGETGATEKKHCQAAEMGGEKNAFVEKLMPHLPACFKASPKALPEAPPKMQEKEIEFGAEFDRFCLMSLLISDDMAVYSSPEFVKQQIADFFEHVDFVQLHRLYEDMAAVVGEPLMEALNQELKRRFLIAPTAIIIAKYVGDSTISRLFARDNTTRRIMYQFIHCSEVKKRAYYFSLSEYLHNVDTSD